MTATLPLPLPLITIFVFLNTCLLYDFSDMPEHYCRAGSEAWHLIHFGACFQRVPDGTSKPAIVIIMYLLGIYSRGVYNSLGRRNDAAGKRLGMEPNLRIHVCMLKGAK